MAIEVCQDPAGQKRQLRSEVAERHQANEGSNRVYLVKVTLDGGGQKLLLAAEVLIQRPPPGSETGELLDIANRSAAEAPLRKEPEASLEETFFRRLVIVVRWQPPLGHGKRMITMNREGGGSLAMASEAASLRWGGGWTSARVFMLVAAVWHLGLGSIGFLYNASFPIGAQATRAGESAHIFGVFETNGWHNAAAFGLGLVTLYFALHPARARRAALVIGLAHVALTLAWMVWDPRMFWVASNTADQFVHASTAIGGIVCGLASPRSAAR